MALHKDRVIQNQQRFSAVFTSKAPFTRYNLLLNRFDNRLYRVYKHSTGCQTHLTTGCMVYTAGCQTGCTTWFDSQTNSGCSFNMLVKPVVQLV